MLKPNGWQQKLAKNNNIEHERLITVRKGKMHDWLWNFVATFVMN